MWTGGVDRWKRILKIAALGSSDRRRLLDSVHQKQSSPTIPIDWEGNLGKAKPNLGLRLGLLGSTSADDISAEIKVTGIEVQWGRKSPSVGGESPRQKDLSTASPRRTSATVSPRLKLYGTESPRQRPYTGEEYVRQPAYGIEIPRLRGFGAESPRVPLSSRAANGGMRRSSCLELAAGGKWKELARVLSAADGYLQLAHLDEEGCNALHR
jgi:hypothetical protein